MPIPQAELNTTPATMNLEYKNEEEEWGEEDEWEWESEEEADVNDTENGNNGVKMPTNNSNGYATNGTTNGTTVTPKQNGNVSNGTTNTTANGYHINEEDHEIEEITGKADIKIQGNLLKIERTGPVEWSDDEYEDDDEEETEVVPKEEPKMAPPPPPPPPAPPAPPPPPPPPPPGNEVDEARARKLQKIEQLKKRPVKRPDWNELMKEIESLRYGKSTRNLKKTISNDRSKPMLTKTKINGKYIYDSEQKAAEYDIFDEIKKGVRLKHVRTNDRSKPNLHGIRSFRRQLTKEERLKTGISMEEPIFDDDDSEDLVKLRDDLESTKQLLELEVRSKKLLEKDNKRLVAELEKLRAEMSNKSGNDTNDTAEESGIRVRRNSMANKRHSIIRLLSDSENKEAEQDANYVLNNNHPHNEDLNEAEEEDDDEEEGEEAAFKKPVTEPTVQSPIPKDKYEDEIMEEIEEMREEVDEARKLAEDWENKYKEMQRQMSELENCRNKKNSLILDSANFDFSSNTQPKTSLASEYEEYYESEEENDDDGDYIWMLKREIHSLNHKLRNIQDKREIVVRERQLLDERIDTLVGSISNELEGRKRLKREIKEMNDAFNAEILEMEAEEKAAQELEDCYFSDEEMVPNTHKRDPAEEEDWEENDDEEDEDLETVEDLVKLAEEDFDEDEGSELFKCYPDSEMDIDESQLEEDDYEPTREDLTKRVEYHNDNVHLMRKSNFLLKAKIDRLYDVLQMQKEKHHDLRMELTRMLADIQ